MMTMTIRKMLLGTLALALAPLSGGTGAGFSLRARGGNQFWFPELLDLNRYAKHRNQTRWAGFGRHEVKTRST
jgi:hypothetical protein